MTDNNDPTLWEIYRGMQRIESVLTSVQAQAQVDRHALRAEFQVFIGQHTELKGRVDSVEDRVDKIEPRTDSAVVNAAFVAGGIAAIGFVISLVWK